jgi:hypothetical protein
MSSANPPAETKAPYNVVMEVGPDLAARWLDGNTHNRPLRSALVDRFARDMQAGRWQLTHQGIAFDPDHVLIDGQHRLWAVVISGVTVRMRVFFNEPLESMQAVDTGLVRSNFDVLHLTGEAGEISAKHLATLRAMLAGDGLKLPKMTVGEEAELMTRHTAAVDFAIEHLGACRFRGVATATVRGIIARAYYSSNHTQLIHFCDVLKTGRTSEDEDGPIQLLWQFLFGSAGAGQSRAVRRMRYAKTERALMAYLRGEPLAKLRSAGGELFPLPEEISKPTDAVAA